MNSLYYLKEFHLYDFKWRVPVSLSLNAISVGSFCHICEETVIHPQTGIHIHLAFIVNDAAFHTVATKSTVRLHLASRCTRTQALLIVLVQKVITTILDACILGANVFNRLNQ